MNAIEKWSVWVTTVLTAVTGAGYFWAKYLNEPAGEFAVVNHPLEPWFLKAHILVSPLLLCAVGMILVRHVWRHYRRNVVLGRKSGIVTALVLAPMVVTGYLIQTLTPEGWVRAMAISHIVFGFLYLAGIGVHQVVTHRLLSGGGRKPGAAGGPREGGKVGSASGTRRKAGSRRRAGASPERASVGGEG